ncbi:MAG: 4Fe-4S dicluster domain-containing protein [Desulfitobacterium hafniense]|nr:4Fe-4S dicluster domain-containing protein [Desulfitobacterium hafniense]
MTIGFGSPKRIFVDQRRCLGCKTCELRCAVERNSLSKALISAVHEDVLPRPRVYVEWDGEKPAPIQCRHCEDAPCLEICSTGAMKRDTATGSTYIDGNKCISCWMCVMVCPYGVIAPAAEKHCADKCDQCFRMAQPYCVASCPTGALMEVSLEEYELELAERRKQG